jgi:hypothetical protein
LRTHTLEVTDLGIKKGLHRGAKIKKRLVKSAGRCAKNTETRRHGGHESPCNSASLCLPACRPCSAVASRWRCRQVC